MATLQPISPLEYITRRDPISEDIPEVSNWFQTETLTLTFGEYVGRPHEMCILHASDLAYYLGNGWYVDHISGKDHAGEWVSVTEAEANADSSAEMSSSSNAQSNGNAYTDGETYSHSTSTGISYTRSNSRSEGDNKSKVTQNGSPYWAAWTTVVLKRRRMQSEAVLSSMLMSFTKAYNEGRDINNDRYYELISLYAIMLSRTESEANSLNLSVEDFKPLANMVIGAVKNSITRFSNAVDGIPDDWLKSREDEINRKFDALVGQAKSKMVSEGTYNSTVWPTTASGIERQRQYALNSLKDDMVTLKIESYGKISEITADIGKKLLDCEIAVIEAQNKFLLGPTEIRNQVFKWMLDFMERRDDEYPGLDQLVTVADKLGYADGGMAAPTT